MKESVNLLIKSIGIAVMEFPAMDEHTHNSRPTHVLQSHHLLESLDDCTYQCGGTASFLRLARFQDLFVV